MIHRSFVPRIIPYNKIPEGTPPPGNPTTYHNGTAWTFTWEHGRQLATMQTGSTTWTNTYNSAGLRTKRTDGTTTYTYYYEEGRLSAIKRNDLNMWIIYDENGPVTLKYGVGTFHYVTNLQGDVVAIVGANGQHLVEYTYDAWGKVTSITGDYAYNLGIHNPILYRGYIYDHETGFYYCQSRYYDPETGRFLNADAVTSNGTGIIGFNMFAYCNNNPVRYVDLTGKEPTEAVDLDGDGEPDYYRYDYSYTYREWINYQYYERTISGSVYIFPKNGGPSDLDSNDYPDGFNSQYDLMIGYYVDTSQEEENPVMYAYQAHKTSVYAMHAIIEVMLQYDRDFDTQWERTHNSLFLEWDAHRQLSIHHSAQNVDFDNREEGWGYLDFYWKAVTRLLRIE